MKDYRCILCLDLITTNNEKINKIDDFRPKSTILSVTYFANPDPTSYPPATFDPIVEWHPSDEGLQMYFVSRFNNY